VAVPGAAGRASGHRGGRGPRAPSGRRASGEVRQIATYPSSRAMLLVVRECPQAAGQTHLAAGPPTVLLGASACQKDRPPAPPRVVGPPGGPASRRPRVGSVGQPAGASPYGWRKIAHAQLARVGYRVAKTGQNVACSKASGANSHQKAQKSQEPFILLAHQARRGRRNRDRP
jgi:hypothetical protein